MRRPLIALPIALSALVLLSAPAASVIAPAQRQDAALYGAGHIHGYTEGYFFPGTIPCTGCPVVPFTIEQGSNVEFSGLDEESHKVVSNKRKRGRPLFSSKAVANGESTVMITEHLKPGVYSFRCFFHSFMLGELEVVK